MMLLRNFRDFFCQFYTVYRMNHTYLTNQLFYLIGLQMTDKVTVTMFQMQLVILFAQFLYFIFSYTGNSQFNCSVNNRHRNCFGCCQQGNLFRFSSRFDCCLCYFFRYNFIIFFQCSNFCCKFFIT